MRHDHGPEIACCVRTQAEDRVPRRWREQGEPCQIELRSLPDTNSQVRGVLLIAETLTKPYGRRVRSEGLVERKLAVGYRALDHRAHDRGAKATPSLIWS